MADDQRATREMTVLSDFETRYDAETAAARLIEAGIPASIVDDEHTAIPTRRAAIGPRVLVRPHEYERARMLTNVLHDVDLDQSPIAPIPPRSAWSGPHHAKLGAFILLMIMIVPAIVIAALALGFLAY